MERAKELGRNLLSMARGGSSEEDGAGGAPKRRSWSDVVSSSPPAKSKTEVRVAAGMPKPSSSVSKHATGSPTKEGSSQKVFSADDVARLVEIARNQLRKEKELSSGWREVPTRESKYKEKIYAQDLVEGYRSSPESPFRCWQCNQPGHKSADCPSGERCFVCNSQEHKRAECPVKRRASRKEKGKAVKVMEEVPRRRPLTGVHISDQCPVVGSRNATPKQPANQQDVGNNLQGRSRNEEQVWKKVMDMKAVTCRRGRGGRTRPGRQDQLHTGRGGKRRICKKTKVCLTTTIKVMDQT